MIRRSKAPALRYAIATKPLAYHLIRADAKLADRVLCLKPLRSMAILDTPPNLPVCKKCLFRLRNLYPD